jgi:two-component sensor histidine kinase
LEKQDTYSRIRVKDNGIGIKSMDDLRKSSSLGFNIVESLVGQIDGEIDIVGENGLSVTVSIPE